MTLATVMFCVTAFDVTPYADPGLSLTVDTPGMVDALHRSRVEAAVAPGGSNTS